MIVSLTFKDAHVPQIKAGLLHRYPKPPGSTLTDNEWLKKVTAAVILKAARRGLLDLRRQPAIADVEQGVSTDLPDEAID